MPVRLGLTFYSVLKLPIADIIACAVAAERSGIQYIFVAESFYRDASALASALAAKTKRIKFGSAVYPIATRTPFQIAMATATLHELSRGRVGFIGLGVGYRARVEQYFGVKVERSLARMKEYTEIIQGLLSGRDFSYRGEFFNFSDFPRLVPRPLSIPILFGSSGPRMLRLAGQVADGVILNSIGTPEYFRHALSLVSEGARDEGRNPGKLEIAASVIVSVADDHGDALAAARPDVLFYLLYPELDPVIEKTPYAEMVGEIRKAHARGDARGALSLLTDDMVDDLTISGTPKECRAKLGKLRALGITLPVVRISVQTFKEAERRGVFLRTIGALSRTWRGR